MSRNKCLSPYQSLTGCTFQYHEFARVLPLLMADDAKLLMREEIVHNRLLQVNSETARRRFMSAFWSRYCAAPRSLWEAFGTMSEQGRRAALFYAILKESKLAFDFHFDIAVKHFHSVEASVELNDIYMEINDIASRDAFVDSWADSTKKKTASAYLTMLRQVGLLDAHSTALKPLHLAPSDFAYYIRSGEEWFLEACLLYPYEIKNVKTDLSYDKQ